MKSRGAYLLAEADARAGVEGEEDERVGREVLLYALVEEPVGVELQGCGGCGVKHVRLNAETCAYHQGPTSPSCGA